MDTAAALEMAMEQEQAMAMVTNGASIPPLGTNKKQAPAKGNPLQEPFLLSNSVSVV